MDEVCILGFFDQMLGYVVFELVVKVVDGFYKFLEEQCQYKVGFDIVKGFCGYVVDLIYQFGDGDD